MHRVVIKGDTRGSRRFDGYQDDTDFTEYMSESMRELVTEPAYLNFVFENGILFARTEYTVSRELNQDELDSLRHYTLGQWSDGIGEGLEQQINVSAWHRNQIVEVTQSSESEN